MICDNADGVVKGRLFFYLWAVFCFAIVCAMTLCACDDGNELNIPIDDGEVTIVFVLNNGEDDVVCHLDDPFPKPIKDGYLFEGWYLDPELDSGVSEEGISQLMDSEQSNGRTLSVYAKWNKIRNFTGVLMRDAFLFYDGKAHLPIIEGLPDGTSVEFDGDSEYVNAGEYEVSAVVSAYGYYDLRLSAKLTIAKAEIDISELTFEDESFVWDGLEKSISVKGVIPGGVAVSYVGNGKCDVGEYTVTAKFEVGENFEPIDDMTATLIIIEKTCTVTFIEEDGSEFTREVGYGKDLDDIPEPAARRGYVGSWSGGSLHDIRENITVRAVYTIEKYPIEYLTNSGEFDGSIITEYTVHDCVLLPIPSREFYTFGGWFENEDFFGEVVAEIAENSVGGKRFYAKWTPIEYTVSYELDGGANQMPNTTDGVQYKYTVESEPLTLIAPTKRGYDFVRWYDSDGNTVEIISALAPATFTLYAEWEAIEYHIVYELNDGTNSAANISVYTVENGTLTLDCAIRRGYIFKGWFKDIATSTEAVTELNAVIDGSVILYAKWEAETYYISYRLDGGTNNEYNPASYTIEDEAVILHSPSKDNFEFNGWFLGADFDGEPVTEIECTECKNIELFAKWTEKIESGKDPNTGEENPNTGNDENDNNDKLKFTVEALNGKNIITAYDYSFGNDIIIPNTVGETKIDGVSAGVLSGAESVEIAAEFTSISADIFMGCSNLKRIVLPSTLTSIPHGLLANCTALESLTVPFAGDKLLTENDDYYYPLGVLFGTDEKEGCYGVTIRQTCVINGQPTVQFNSQPTRYIPSSLKKVTVLDGDVIGYAFYGFEGLREIEVLGNGTQIYECAFRNCSALETLNLPKGVTTIVRDRLLGCGNLSVVYVGREADIASIKTVLAQIGADNAEVLVYFD